ncbi:uncharacterized protein LOC142348199 [Convolutriloba macropyga]|uniref:uncharacterized protein LOC142348199 n=1 Tax=Convolutriloba macropyga TaxID=536237 RepID=UPI003F522CE3
MSKSKSKDQIQYRTFDKPEEDKTAKFIIEVEGKKLRVHREYVAQFSPIWKKMMLVEHKDDNKIVFHDQKLEDIRELLQCLYPPNFKPIDDSNVDTMMTCAMQFQIDLIKRRSREFIELKLEEQLNSRTGGAVNHMLLILERADRFDMQDIVEKCAQWFAKQSTSKVQDAIRRVSAESGLILAQERMLFVDKKLREVEKKNRDLETKIQIYNLTADK